MEIIVTVFFSPLIRIKTYSCKYGIAIDATTQGQAAGWIYAISQLGRLACGVFIDLYVAIISTIS
jgi:hypothetical protein